MNLQILNKSLYLVGIDGLVTKNKFDIPIEYDKNRIDRDGEHYHITIIHKTEKEFNKDDMLPKIENIDLCSCGIGKVQKNNNISIFMIVVSNYLNELRKNNNLESKIFHITLGFLQKDIHDIPIRVFI